jgi:hypothetical protein
MYWSLTVLSTLQSSDAAADSVSRAEELLDLITSPTSIATLVLLAFARGRLDRNAEQKDSARTWFALLASIGAIVITVAIVVVMLPLTARILVRNTGGVETVLLVYCLTHMVAIGTAIYAVKVAGECIKEKPWSDTEPEP